MQSNNLIDIPLEFRLACLVEEFDIQKVLQAFIDNISFYATLSKDYLKGYTEATDALSEYIFANSHPVSSEAFTKNKDLAAQCVMGVLKIGVQKGNPKKKKIKSQKYIKVLSHAMERCYSTDKLYLDEETVLFLSEDFQLVCEFHSHYPKEYLEYFMSKIDLADYVTRVSLNKIDVNNSMAFFEMLMKRLIDVDVHNSTKPATEFQLEFIDKLQQLHAKVFIVRNFEKRKAVYHDLFLNYYNQTLKKWS